MSLKTHDLNAQAWAYILDCISSEDVQLTTHREKVEYAWKCYCSEGRTPYHLHAHKGNEVNAFADFLRGIPSWLHVATYDYEILELAKAWGSLPKRPRPVEEARIIDGFYNYIAVKFFQLRTKLETRDYLPEHLLTLKPATA